MEVATVKLLEPPFEYETIKSFISFFSLDLTYLLISSFTQTLTTLDLNSDNIEDKGAQQLADALRNNNVKIFFLHLFHLSLFRISYRRSKTSISITIELEPQEYNISLMSYETTQ